MKIYKTTTNFVFSLIGATLMSLIPSYVYAISPSEIANKILNRDSKISWQDESEPDVIMHDPTYLPTKPLDDTGHQRIDMQYYDKNPPGPTLEDAVVYITKYGIFIDEITEGGYKSFKLKNTEFIPCTPHEINILDKIRDLSYKVLSED